MNRANRVRYVGDSDGVVADLGRDDFGGQVVEGACVLRHGMFLANDMRENYYGFVRFARPEKMEHPPEARFCCPVALCAPGDVRSNSLRSAIVVPAFQYESLPKGRYSVEQPWNNLPDSHHSVRQRLIFTGYYGILYTIPDTFRAKGQYFPLPLRYPNSSSSYGILL